ncbi:hypothetical protein GEMRC1_013606 [Eukaryota sp. GEM-RC1]
MSKFVPLDDDGNPIDIPSPSVLSEDENFLSSFSDSDESVSESTTFSDDCSPAVLTFQDHSSDSFHYLPDSISTSPPPSQQHHVPCLQEIPSAHKSSFPFNPVFRCHSSLCLYPACTQHVSITSPHSLTIFPSSSFPKGQEVFCDSSFSLSSTSLFDVSYSYSQFISSHFDQQNPCTLTLLSNNFSFLFFSSESSEIPILNSLLSLKLQHNLSLKLSAISITPNRLHDVIGNVTLPQNTSNFEPVTKAPVSSVPDYVQIFKRITNNINIENNILLLRVYFTDQFKQDDDIDYDLGFSLLYVSNSKGVSRSFDRFFENSITGLCQSLTTGQISKSFRDRRLLTLISESITTGCFFNFISTNGTEPDLSNLKSILSMVNSVKSRAPIPEGRPFKSSFSDSRVLVDQVKKKPSAMSIRSNVSRISELRSEIERLKRDNARLLAAHKKEKKTNHQLSNNVSQQRDLIDSLSNTIDNQQKQLDFYKQKFDQQNHQLHQLLAKAKQLKKFQDETGATSENDQIQSELLLKLKDLITHQQQDITELKSKFNDPDGDPSNTALSVSSQPTLTDISELISVVIEIAKSVVDSTCRKAQKSDASQNTPESVAESLDESIHGLENSFEDSFVLASLPASSFHQSLSKLSQLVLELESSIEQESSIDDVINLFRNLLNELNTCCSSSARVIKILFND